MEPGTSDSRSWGSQLGDFGKKNGRTLCVFLFFVLMSTFFWGLVGLDPRFFLLEGIWDICSLCFFWMKQSYAEMVQ